MAIATNIALFDAQAIPVSHTFVPLGPQGNFDMVWEDQSQTSPNGYWRIGVSQKRSNGKVASGAIKTVITLLEPVLEAIAPAASGLTQPPTVAYVPTCRTEYLVSERSSLEVRKHLRKMNANLQAEAQITAWVESLIPAY